MNVKTKRHTDTDRQKEERKEKVIIAAIEVFKEKGIENAKMTDIAEKAAIGVASVYRYFKTKPELVIAAAVKFWDLGLAALSDDYAEAVQHELNGLAQVRQILQVSFTVYHEHQDFIRFLEELDYYILKEQIGFEKLAVYENNIFHAKTLLFAALETGKRDGSIRPDIDNNRFCITITRVLMSLCQKLALRGIVLPSDSEIAGEVQLGILIDMAVRYIQK
jgi:AcrR family transcriptional regulator